MEKIKRQSDVFKMPDGRHRAATGLFLEVRGGGAHRSWIWVYEENRKRHVKGLGSAKQVSLAQAKDIVLRNRARLLSGEPMAEESPEAVPTFGEALKLAMEQRKSSSLWRESTQAKWELVVRRHIPDSIKQMPVNEISRADLLAVLRPLWEKMPRSGEAARQMLSLAFTYSAHQGWIDSNPAAWKGCLEFELPNPNKVAPVVHQKAMSFEMVCRLMPSFAGKTVTHKAIAFGTLTATRVGEFCSARWAEVDLGTMTWTIPPVRRKDGKPEPFVVPLSKQAVRLLEALEQEGEWIFQGRGSHIRKSTPAVLLRRGYGVTMHGMRSVFRSWCADTGVAFEVAESCLMHSAGSQVTRSYQRSNLLALRRDVLQRWADTIMPV